MIESIQYRLNSVRLFTTDFKRAVNFYSETLGMTSKDVNETEGYAVYAVGDAQLLIEVMDPSDSEAKELVGRFAGVSFTVDDIQDAYESLSAKGVRFTNPPQKQSWGGVLTHFHDPDDNVLTLVQ